MKKVVITGGAGFIGSHLSEELARRGYHTIILDDLSTGKKENIEPLLKRENVEFIKGSITDLPLLQKVFSCVLYVFHMEAVTSVPQSIENPQASHEVNATGTLNVLLAARDNSVSKVNFSSSAAVYGDTPAPTQKEDMLPSPQSPYAVAKLTGEYYCRVFQEVYALPTACLRYFNVYGSRQDPLSQYAAVIPRFLTAVSQGNPPIIFGDGEQTRDFIFIKDVVTANILVAESEMSGVYNIGKGERTSINQLAEIIISLTGKDIKPVYEKPRAGDIIHSLADISRVGSFGYKPQYSLVEGIKQILEQP